MTHLRRSFRFALLVFFAVVGPTTSAPAQDVLVAGWSSHNIIRYDADTGDVVGVFASGGGLTNPHTVRYGPDGHLYVASAGNDLVLRYDGETGAFIGIFANAGLAGSSFTLDAAFGPDGQLYVTSFTTSAVLRFDGTTGEFLDVFVASGSGGLNGAETLSWDADGDLLVCSTNTSAVLEYDGTTGAPLGAFVSPGSGGLASPHCATFAPDGLFLYVTAFNGANPILRYASDTGTFLGAFDPATASPLSSAHCVQFAPNGDLYACSFAGSAVYRFDGVTGAWLDVIQGGGLSSASWVAFLPPPSPLVFRRGDANQDGVFDIADAIATLGALFSSEPTACELALDSNDDEATDIADAIYSLTALFGAGPSPLPPFPDCGADPTAGALGCDAFAACP